MIAVSCFAAGVSAQNDNGNGNNGNNGNNGKNGNGNNGGAAATSTSASETYVNPVYAPEYSSSLSDEDTTGGQDSPDVIETDEPEDTTTVPETRGEFEDISIPSVNYGCAEIDSDPEDLMEAVLTDRDYDAMADGENVYFFFSTDEFEPGEDEKALTESTGYAVAAYININLKKTTGEKVRQVTETKGKLTIALTLPEDIETEGRIFKVLRIHNDEITILDTKFDPDTRVLTFRSDKFSTYVVAYTASPVRIGPQIEAVPDIEAETNPRTGAGLVGIGMIAVSAAAALVSRKRK
jgi:hypothetical protein